MEHADFNFEGANRSLTKLPLLQGLNEEQLWLAQTVFNPKEVPSGQILMSQEQVGEIVYIIAEGTVRISVWRNNKSNIIGLRGVGDVLGEMSVLDGDRRSATVITQSSCLLFWVSRADFWNTLWPMPQFSLNMTLLLAKRVRTLTGQLEAMATLPVAGRLARLLVDLAGDYGFPNGSENTPEAIEIPFRLTQVELASMIGATRVQVNQVFNIWKKQGFIAIYGNRLNVLNEAALRELVG